MKAPGGDELAALRRADRQVAGGGDARRPLVQPGARERQAGQLGHRRLELEHRLQAALGDLGLVGRVRGQELGAGDDRVDDRRRVVVVHPGAEEADLRFGVGVTGGERSHPLVDLGLRQAVGQLERAVEPDARGHVEELLDRGDADLVEHLATLVVGDGGVAAHPEQVSQPRGAASTTPTECSAGAGGGQPASARAGLSPLGVGSRRAADVGLGSEGRNAAVNRHVGAPPAARTAARCPSAATRGAGPAIEMRITVPQGHQFASHLQFRPTEDLRHLPLTSPDQLPPNGGGSGASRPPTAPAAGGRSIGDQLTPSRCSASRPLCSACAVLPLGRGVSRRSVPCRRRRRGAGRPRRDR